MRTSIFRILLAYEGRIEWHNHLNGSGKPKQSKQEVAAQMRGFAAWHNANLKQKTDGGMGR